MAAPNFLRTPAKWGLAVAGYLAFVAPFLTRLVIGQSFYFSGKGKFDRIDGTIEFFTNLNIPYPAANAYFVASIEMAGGLLLMIGLLSRLSSLFLSSTMVVALLTAHREEVLTAVGARELSSLADVSAAAFLIFLLWILFYGPGVLSVDWLLLRWLKLDKK